MQSKVEWGLNGKVHSSILAPHSAGWTKEMEEEERRERRRRQRQKVLSCCKSMVAFLFSHIGLAAMVVAYSIMGGFLFRALEQPYEYKEKLRIIQYKEEQVEAIWALSAHLSMNNLVKENFTARVREIFMNFQQEVTVAVKEKGWDGKDDTDETALQWSFAGALLYAVTVITTIGYGHVAPKTTAGRLITILYALVGIPLTFLYLSNIGNFLAEGFRLFYKKICCDICCCQKCERQKKRERLRLRLKRIHGGTIRNNTNVPRPPPPPPLPHHVPAIKFDSDPDITNIPPDDEEEDDEVFSVETEGLPGAHDLYDDTSPIMSVSDDNFCTNGGCATPSDRFPSPTLLRGEGYDKPWDLEGLDDENLQETAIIDSDSDDEDDVQETALLDSDTDVRETAILDSDTDEEMIIWNSGLHNNPNSPFDETLDDRMPRNILESDDEHYSTPRKHKVSPVTSTSASVHDTLQVRNSSSPRTLSNSSCLELDPDKDTDTTRPKTKGEKHVSADKQKSDKKEKKKEKEKAGKKAEAKNDKDKKEKSKKEDKVQHKKEKPSKEDKELLKRKETMKKDRERALTRGRSATVRRPKELSPHQGYGTMTLSRNRSATVKRDKSKSPLKRSRSLPDKKYVLSKPKNDLGGTLKREKSKEKKSDNAQKQKEKDIKKDDKSKDKSAKKGKEKNNVAHEDNTKDISDNKGKCDKNRKTLVKEKGDKKDKANKKEGKSKLNVKNNKKGDFYIESDPPSYRSDLSRSDTMKRSPLNSSDKGQRQPTVKRKSTKKGKSSMRRIGSSASAPNDDELVRRTSDGDSFVTAASESFEDGFDNEVFEEDNVVTKQPFSTNVGHVSIDIDSPYDIEMAEYQDNHMNYNLDESYNYDDDDGKVTVPISICLIIIAGYIFAGAVLFTLWEDWDYITGSYFCFITLSTIGFGDIVPGTDMDAWASHEKLVLCALWLAFGLSLLAMCFNLMQEEVKEKVKWLGQKIGLLRDDDEG